ncbi:MAG: hypothetical protein ACFFFC_14215 [Candidatus Thorarchaeota archaeon]
MTKDKPTLVPTSSMNFEKQVRILRAYVVLTNYGKAPVHYIQVVRSSRVARTQVSGVNSFFVTLGFLEEVEQGIYLPKKEVVDFFNETPGEENFGTLSPLLKESPLYNFIKNLILIHGIVTYEQGIEHLLEESGEKTVSRAKRSLDWLQRSGLIALKDGNLIVLTSQP